MIPAWLILTIFGISGGDAGGAMLEARFPPATAVVEAAASPQSRLTLPDLAFEGRVIARCATGAPPESLTIAVADTRVALSPEAAAPPHRFAARFVVPAGQLAPVAVAGFCPDEHGSGRALDVDDILTAQVAMHCAAPDDRSTVRYLGVALDIRIRCRGLPETGWGLSRR